jgi:hypothetical protein
LSPRALKFIKNFDTASDPQNLKILYNLRNAMAFPGIVHDTEKMRLGTWEVPTAYLEFLEYYEHINGLSKVRDNFHISLFYINLVTIELFFGTTTKQLYSSVLNLDTIPLKDVFSIKDKNNKSKIREFNKKALIFFDLLNSVFVDK